MSMTPPFCSSWCWSPPPPGHDKNRARKGPEIKLPEDQKLKVGVIGGGLAGMITSMDLAEAGHEVEIFEARPFMGGKVREPAGRRSIWHCRQHGSFLQFVFLVVFGTAVLVSRYEFCCGCCWSVVWPCGAGEPKQWFGWRSWDDGGYRGETVSIERHVRSRRVFLEIIQSQKDYAFEI